MAEDGQVHHRLSSSHDIGENMPQIILIGEPSSAALQACKNDLEQAQWQSPDDVNLEALLHTADHPILLVMEGHRFQTIQARLAPSLTPLPGFGEALRRALPLPDCLTTFAWAGAAKDAQVIACVSASPAAASQALKLLESLPSPQETSPAVVVDSSIPPRGVSIEQSTEQQAPTSVDALSPWKKGLEHLAATLERDRWYALPDQIAEQTAACDVLLTAGERGVVTLEDGREVGIFGFPDLRRPSSKVLMVTVTRGVFEAVALHRFPNLVGIVGRGSLLKHASVDDEAQQRTGMPAPYGGTLFALEHSAIIIERDDKLVRWDGSREVSAGTESQAIASLLLRWSSR